MIAFLLALQTAVAPTVIIVRNGSSVAQVPVTTTAGEPTVRADALMKAMQGMLITGTNLHYTIVLPRARLDVIDGIPFAKRDSLTIPLTKAPQVHGGELYLPFQFVSEVIPRYGGGYFYDPAVGELRTFVQTVSNRPPPARTGAATASAQTTSTPSPRRTSRPLVVVDAGHGGPDHGMSGPIGSSSPWFVEKDVTLSVAKKLAATLRAQGVDVLMTRTTDTLIALSDRGRIANANHGDIFVSIHVNAPGGGTSAAARERGFETYFLAEAKTEDERRVQDMENESVKFETGANAPKGDPLSFIITDMAQNEHLRESSDLAQTIQQGLIDVHPGPNRGVQQANFAVLRGSYMPAVLVEIGFGTNQSEATYLSDDANQRALARSISQSVIAYLAHYESRVGGTR
jgi:N-acetylmuramoyl-L-alanine amidase